MRSLLVGVILLTAVAASADSNGYINESSIGEVPKNVQPSSAAVQSIEPLRIEWVQRPGEAPASPWVGQRFIFLPCPKARTSSCYRSFKDNLNYSDWVGKIVTVRHVSYGGPSHEVFFTTSDGKELHATAYDGSVEGIALVSDLDLASRWTGKTLWLRDRGVLETYDATTGEGDSERVGRLAKVRVKAVVAGWTSARPARFIVVSEDGREGFVDVQISGTNTRRQDQKGSRLEDVFYDSDPHRLHKGWPKWVWRAISDEVVLPGMTPEQVRMIRGRPDTVNTTITGVTRWEQWVYPQGTFIYFENDRVVAKQF
jgi:hypothetical protein